MPFSDLPDSVKAEYDRIGRERELASREAERFQRWELLRVCGEMIGWTVLGLIVASFAFQVDEYSLGMVFLYAGMAINVGGVGFSVWSAYMRGERRGDW